MVQNVRFRPLSFFTLTAFISAGMTLTAQRVEYSSAQRGAQTALPQTLSGATPALRQKIHASHSGIALVVADFDGDGTQDLITGYAVTGGGAFLLQRGLSAATAPGETEHAMLAAGQFVAPYAAKAEVVALPSAPDLLLTADLSGFGHADLLAGAKGESTLYVLQNRGNGSFTEPRAVALAGPVSAVRTWRNDAGETMIVAAVCRAGGGCGLQFLSAAGESVAFVPTKKAVRSFEVVSANGGPVQDVLAIVGREAVLIEGESLLSSAPVSQTLPVGNAVAATAGSFIYSFRTGPQLAVLDANANVHVLSRGALNPHQVTVEEARAARRARTTVSTERQVRGTWTEVERTSNFGTGAADSLLLKGHFTANGQDDLLLLSRGQSFRLSYPSLLQDDVRRSEAVVTVDSTGEAVTAAAAARVSADSRMGLVSVDRSGRPQIAVPPTYKIYTINTTTDAVPTTAATTACRNGASGCTLRAAISLVNSDASYNRASGTIDTINMPAGTYIISATNGSATDTKGDRNYHYDVDGPVNIVGAGQTTTIIDGNTLDNVFDIDSSVVNPSAPFDVFVSNLTVRNGLNSNNAFSNSNSYNYLGGLVDWDSDGAGYLTLSHVSLTNGKASYGPGGGLAAFSSNSSTDGTLELDNSTVSGNSTPETGGGLSLGAGNPLVLNTTTLSSNTAAVTVNSADQARTGEGGGIATSGGSTSTPDTIINSTISGNTSTTDGGGLAMLNGFTMSGTTVSGNQAGSSAGGLYYFPFNTAASITTSNFVTNQITGGDGAGICYALQTTQQLTLTMHFARIHGNTGGTHTGLAVGCNVASGYAPIAATDNWWGCNGPASGTGCDTAGTTSGSSVTSGSTVTTPYTTLIETLSSSTPGYGATLTATGSLGQDSAGTVYAYANDAGYAGVAATNIITQSGNSTNSTATTLNASGAIVTSAPVSASGSATVTVDGTSVTRNFTYTLPTTTKVNPVSTPNQVGNSTTVSVSVTDPNNASDVSQTGTVTLYDKVGNTQTTQTLTLSGSNTVSYTYTQSLGGSHTITAAYTPAAGTAYVASADNTGQTFTVSPGTLSNPAIVSTVQVGAPLTVKPGNTLLLTINFAIPGTVAPSGAFTATVDKSSTGVTLNGCAYKPKHANCSVSYVGSATTGSHTFSFTQAADANYTAVSGSATITVSP